MKGIVLAGGSGSRLFPLTKTVSKQLLPVYDKPAIYYPISILMLANIKDILIISTPRDLPMIQNLLKDGSQLGVSFSYEVQEKPEGIAQAFILGEEFIQNDSVCLILGDNLFYARDLNNILTDFDRDFKGAHIFAYHVNDPERYGVVNFDYNFNVTAIEEKPLKATSNWAITGLYFYDNKVVDLAKKLKPSKRGELEITDLNLLYLKEGNLKVNPLGRGFTWLDIGTPESLLEASHFVYTIEKRQGLKIACLEEIAYLKKFISKEKLLQISDHYSNNNYGSYLKKILEYEQFYNLV